MLETAIELFEKGEYDAAVESLVCIYESGYYKEEIREFLYANFITPNEEEYKSVYLSSLNEVNVFPYDDLALDFISVSDKKYYIYDKIQKHFLGVVDFDTLHQKRNAGCDEKKDVRAVLVSNVWDIRLIIENIYNTIWNSTYVICDTNVNRLFSFLKIPKIKSLFYNDVVFFENQDILYEYFVKNDNKYLPRIMLGNDEERYYDIIEMLHKERIARKRNSNSILVSFCIPSYNRGNLAYENVTRYLQTEYDSEIEIVLSNNGSEVNTEGYDKLEKIQDSRLVYNKLDENKGFIGNLLAVMNMAKGKFVVLSSDEDFFDINMLTKFMNSILFHENVAVMKTTGIGTNFLTNQPYGLFEEVQSRLGEVINLNYVTGICFNNLLMKKHSVIQDIQKWENNFFYVTYPHICIAYILCQYDAFARLPLILWKCNESEDKNTKETIYRTYCNLDSRITQQNEAITFIVKATIPSNRNALLQMFADRIAKTYHLINIATEEMGDLFRKDYSWMQICFKIHINNMTTIEKYKNLFSEEENKKTKLFCDEVFLRNLQENPFFSIMSDMEKGLYVVEVKKVCAFYKENKTFVGYADYC